MSSRWESIVVSAREIDEAFANGKAPDPALVMRLARAVLDFQQHLAGARLTTKATAPASA
jgi:hypothetical protein